MYVIVAVRNIDPSLLWMICNRPVWIVTLGAAFLRHRLEQLEKSGGNLCRPMDQLQETGEIERQLLDMGLQAVRRVVRTLPQSSSRAHIEGQSFR